MINYEDREMVRELYSRYAHTLDEGRNEEWVDCFTPDGVFDSPWVGRHAGRENLLAMVSASAGTELGRVKQRHLMANISLDLEEDQGTGTCNFTYYWTREGKTELIAIGVYQDSLRKIDGRWRFARRLIRLDSERPAYWPQLDPGR
jgi:3-phenylpropionate/cinnamic acid dioxygenase small subunit